MDNASSPSVQDGVNALVMVQYHQMIAGSEYKEDINVRAIMLEMNEKPEYLNAVMQAVQNNCLERIHQIADDVGKQAFLSEAKRMSCAELKTVLETRAGEPMVASNLGALHRILKEKEDDEAKKHSKLKEKLEALQGAGAGAGGVADKELETLLKLLDKFKSLEPVRWFTELTTNAGERFPVEPAAVEEVKKDNVKMLLLRLSLCSHVLPMLFFNVPMEVGVTAMKTLMELLPQEDYCMLFQQVAASVDWKNSHTIFMFLNMLIEKLPQVSLLAGALRSLGFPTLRGIVFGKVATQGIDTFKLLQDAVSSWHENTEKLQMEFYIAGLLPMVAWDNNASDKAALIAKLQKMAFLSNMTKVIINKHLPQLTEGASGGKRARHG